MKLFVGYRNRIKSFRLWSDKRSLRSDLEGLIKVMEGHKAAGLPSGHRYYSMLWQRAKTDISNFTGKHGGNFDEVAVGVPMLRQMEQLTASETKPSAPVMGVVGTIALVVLGLVGSAVFGIYHDVYVMVTHLVH